MNPYNPSIAAAFISAMFSVKAPKNYVGKRSFMPYPQPINGKQAWKVRRQHGTGKR